MSSTAQAIDSNRAFVPILIFAALALIVFFRLFYLQVIVAGEYSEQAEDARLVSIDVDARRGTIYDRNGTVLAISVDATTVYCNPSEVNDAGRAAQLLSETLGGQIADYLGTLTQSNLSFAYIAQKIDVEVALDLEAKLDEAQVKGVYFLDDTRREYPNGQVGGQIIGACEIAIDEESGTEYYSGISGLEALFE